MIGWIEISMVDNCNSKCIMCPSRLMYKSKAMISHTQLSIILRKIKGSIKEKLIIENPIFVIGFFGEPFLDSELFEKIDMIKANLSESKINIYTNGLTLDKFEALLLESNENINELIISNYGDTLEQFNFITQLNMKENKFKKMKAVIERLKEKINIRMWNAWNEDLLFDFSTRAGLVKEIIIKKEIYECSWFRPYRYLNILTNGDLILCCQDWKRETKYGNILIDDLVNILKGDCYKDLMDKATGKKESDLLFICKRCKFNNEKEEEEII